MFKIALIEDDHHLAQTIVEFLSLKGYMVEHFDDGDSFIDGLKISAFSLIILDLMMQKIDGFDVLKYLNNAKSKIPIIVVSGLSDVDNLENAFELGAVDYVKKPLILRELLVRIKRFDMVSHNFYFFKELYFNSSKKILYKDDKEIVLSPKQKEILGLFVKYPSDTISYDFLQISIWDSVQDIKINTIATYIRDINKVIFPAKIKNIQKIGYKLTLP